MASPGYNLLNVKVEGGVRTIVIHHQHPACIMTGQLAGELNKVTDEAIADEKTRVIVIRSADPDIFIAHFDVSRILTWQGMNPEDEKSPFSAKRLAALSAPGASILKVENGRAVSTAEKLRRCEKVSIVEIAGRAGGGGNELCSGCDMRFGLAGKTKLNQMEVPLGILPGGNGTVNLPKIIGPNRALEMILGGVDIDAETALQWGYLNRIFASREALSAHVDMLAHRIAAFPTKAVVNSKKAVLNSSSMSQEDALTQEWILSREAIMDPASKSLMTAFLEEKGGQTREGELKVGELAPYLPFEKHSKL